MHFCSSRTDYIACASLNVCCLGRLASVLFVVSTVPGSRLRNLAAEQAEPWSIHLVEFWYGRNAKQAPLLRYRWPLNKLSCWLWNLGPSARHPSQPVPEAYRRIGYATRCSGCSSQQIALFCLSAEKRAGEPIYRRAEHQRKGRLQLQQRASAWVFQKKRSACDGV